MLGRVILIACLSAAAMVAVAIAKPTTWVFHVPGYPPVAAAKVGDFSASAPEGRQWPYVSRSVTVICARGGFAVVLGSTDVLALNGFTSSFGGVVRQDDGLKTIDLPIIGISVFEEARHSSIVLPNANADDVYGAAQSLLNVSRSDKACN